MHSKRIKVLIADDHVLFCQGLKALFEKVPEIDIVGEVHDGKQAVDLAITLVPDVILMNIMTPVMDGIGALRRIKALQPLLHSQKPGGVMTQRERELARLISDGYSTKEAAEVLNISPKTAETHRAAIMKKLDARNVADIVKYCIRNQIIEI